MKNIIKIEREEDGWFHVYLDRCHLFCDDNIEQVCMRLCRLVRGLEK